MMQFPESFVTGLEGKPLSELVAARGSLIDSLRVLEEGFLSDEPGCVMMDPSPGVQYVMLNRYLAALAELMARRAPEFSGEGDLCP